MGGLEVYRGGALHAIFSSVDEDGTPISLAGYHAKLQARTKPTSNSVLLEASTDDGSLEVEPGGATGEIHLSLGADVTVNCRYNGVFDCLAWHPSSPNEVLVIAAGPLTVTERVTRV